MEGIFETEALIAARQSNRVVARLEHTHPREKVQAGQTPFFPYVAPRFPISQNLIVFFFSPRPPKCLRRCPRR